MLIWKAFYKDGTELPQYGVNGKNDYPSIDRTKLLAFALVDRTIDADRSILVPLMNSNYQMAGESAWHFFKDRVIFRMHLEEGQKLIYRKIGSKQLNTRTGKETRPDEHFIMIGWQQNVRGQNIQCVNYYTPAGVLEQTGKFHLGTPKLIDCEK